MTELRHAKDCPHERRCVTLAATVYCYHCGTNLRLRRADVLKAIKAQPGMTAKYLPDTGEYRVAFTGPDSEASAYYTADPADALDTALAMQVSKEN